MHHHYHRLITGALWLVCENDCKTTWSCDTGYSWVRPNNSTQVSRNLASVGEAFRLKLTEYIHLVFCENFVTLRKAYSAWNGWYWKILGRFFIFLFYFRRNSFSSIKITLDDNYCSKKVWPVKLRNSDLMFKLSQVIL